MLIWDASSVLCQADRGFSIVLPLVFWFVLFFIRITISFFINLIYGLLVNLSLWLGIFIYTNNILAYNLRHDCVAVQIRPPFANADNI